LWDPVVCDGLESILFYCSSLLCQPLLQPLSIPPLALSRSHGPFSYRRAVTYNRTTDCKASSALWTKTA